ncbi:3404_t:CDS:2 [Rhizophagus irregularis]|nr:3404_t:CDS:2 [Rhizophagus irregularis]
MGNNISSSERKNKKIEFYKEIDNRTTDLEVEKELKYYIPNNYEDIDREHMFHFFQSPDMFDGLPFPDNEFDFVRESSMSFLVKADQWDFIISEMIRVTKPDGYVELHEPYSTFNGIGPVLSKMHDAHTLSCLQRGVDMKIIINIDRIIQSNQNTPIVYKDEKSCILGPNGDKIGIVIQDLFMGFHDNEVAMENLSPVLGISKEEYKIMMKDLIEEFKNTSPEYKLIRFWAKKN